MIDADIVSIDAVVSSTEAACSLADCDRLCAVALTWLAAPVSASAAERTSSMTAASFSQPRFASSRTCANTPGASPPIRCVRSPVDSAAKTRPTSANARAVVSISELMPSHMSAMWPLRPSSATRRDRSPSLAAFATCSVSSTAARSVSAALTCAVTSLAYLTTLNGLPFRSRIGLYDAWIQTSRPPLARRLYSPASNSPRPSFSQNRRYSSLAAWAGSANMLWWRPRISSSE